MKIKHLLITAFFISINFLNAQTDQSCACCTEDHRAFDFWVGDWEVLNQSGKIVGTNNIIKMQANCVIQENWVASGQTNTGTSYNYYNQADKTWNQVWISGTGNILELKGNLNKAGEMVLKSEMKESPRGKYMNQITWSKNDDGTVMQTWLILDENGKEINQAFTGIYRKK
jgi:hypothetical protein